MCDILDIFGGQTVAAGHQKLMPNSGRRPDTIQP